MVVRGRRGASLSTQLLWLTVVIVGLIVTVVVAAGIVGVYSMTRSEMADRQVVYRRLMARGVAVRLDAADEALDSLAVGLRDARRIDEVRSRVVRIAAVEAEHFDMLVFRGDDGRILASTPVFENPRKSLDAVLSGSSPTSEGLVYVWRPGIGDVEGRLWLLREVRGGPWPGVLYARLRTDFVHSLAAEISSDIEERAVLILGPGSEVIAADRGGSPMLEKDLGSGVVRRADGEVSVGSGSTSLVGEIMPIQGFPGLDWSVVVASPKGLAATRTSSALAPAFVTLVAGAFLAIALAVAATRRIVEPLRELEIRAHDVASGAFVRPIPVERQDEVGRLAVAFNDMAVRLNSLHDLSQLLATSSRLDHVLDGILTAMGHILQTGGVAVFLVDAAGDRAVLARAKGLPEEPSGFSVDLRRPSWIAEALDTGTLVSFRRQHGDRDPLLDLYGADTIRCGLVVPLSTGVLTLGLVVVVCSEERTFTAAETEMARTFSAQASIAVYNSHLFAEERAARLEAEVLRRVAERLAAPGDLEAALSDVADMAADLLGMRSAEVAVADRTALGLAPSSDPAHERALLTSFASVDEGGDPALPLLVDGGEALERARELLGEDITCALILPIVVDGCPAAALALTGWSAGERIGERQMVLAETIGREASLALENTRLFNQARVRATDLEMIFRISQAVTSELELPVVLNRVLDVVQKIVSAEAVSLMMYDSASRRVTTEMSRGIGHRDLVSLSVAPGEGVAGRVFESGEAVNIEDLATVDEQWARLALSQGFASAVIVSLTSRGRRLGTLAAYARDRGAFRDEDLVMLRLFATQAALSVDTAALFGQEHHVASVLRASILPERVAAVPGLDAHARYLAAGKKTEGISGDYYDLFTTPDGRIVLAMADVCGKGVTAATKTSMIKFTVRGMAAAGAGPAAIVTELNRVVSETGLVSDIVTLWVGVVDLQRSSLLYANGGHPPALLLRTDGHTERLGPTGPLLGAIADAHFGEIAISLETGATLLLYTDGVTEARRSKEFFGEDRVRRLLRRGGNARSITDRLLSALERFVGTDLRDDAAVLAVRVAPRDRSETSVSVRHPNG